MEFSGMPVFPVMFNDGENESMLGDLIINPGMDFKSFLTIICERIQISPNQVSVFLSQNNDPNSMTLSEDTRVIPITGDIGFSILHSLKERCFLVVLQRSRKPRIRPEKTTSGAEFAGLSAESMYPRPPLPDNRTLRRRNQSEMVDLNGRQQMDDLENRLRSAMVQNRMENYHMATANGYVPDPNLDLVSFPPIDGSYRVNSRLSTTEKNVPQKKKKFYCGECRKAKKTGVTTPFHPCPNDPVVSSFRTRFGPISRPH